MTPELHTPTVSLPDHEKPVLTVDDVIGLRDRESRQEYPLDPEGIAFSVGSNPRAEVYINTDEYVSRDHCYLVRKDGLRVFDKSKNGLWVSKVRCKEAFLHDGAHLQLGKTTLIAYSSITRHDLTPLERLVGQDPAFAQVRELALTVAATRAHALIIGEPGVGKRTVAQMIHQESARATHPWVTLDCSTLGATEVTAELSGDVNAPAIARARGGTLLLHLVEHMPDHLAATVMLLMRRADEHEVRIVLTSAARSAAISAHWQWARDMATVLALPALRDRWTDVPALIDMIMYECRSISGHKRISTRALAALCGFEWPGNVAQLRDAVRQACASTSKDELRPDDFLPTRSELMRCLRRACETAYDAQGSLRGAAGSLGLPYKTFVNLLQQLGIEKK